MTDRGGSVKWSYQPKSHKLKDTTINHGSYNNTTNYEYNAVNQNTKVIDNGKTFYFDYDEFGNVVRQYVYSVDGIRLAMKSQGQTVTTTTTHAVTSSQ